MHTLHAERTSTWDRADRVRTLLTAWDSFFQSDEVTCSLSYFSSSTCFGHNSPAGMMLCSQGYEKGSLSFSCRGLLSTVNTYMYVYMTKWKDYKMISKLSSHTLQGGWCERFIQNTGPLVKGPLSSIWMNAISIIPKSVCVCEREIVNAILPRTKVNSFGSHNSWRFTWLRKFNLFKRFSIPDKGCMVGLDIYEFMYM